MSSSDANKVKFDNRLQLGYGSAWHLLRCLGWHRDKFTQGIEEAIGVASIEWLDFPIGGRNLYPNHTPIRDGEWKRLAFCDSAELRLSYDSFWPTVGEQQNWDAVGRSTSNDRQWILVEAKGNTDEIKFKGTGAKEHGGRPVIRQSFVETLIACGFSKIEATDQAEAWLTGCYQHANRIATLHFLHKHGIPAQLVFLYFCGDEHPSGRFCPLNAKQWSPTIETIDKALGLRGQSNLERFIHNIFLNISDISIEVVT
jgi:hypothetical protein